MANDLIIAVRLSGGLGNQLHQYAYGYFLSKKTGGSLCVDTSFYDLNSQHLKITPRKYELNKLMVEAEEFRFFLSNYNALRLTSKFLFVRKILHRLFKIKIVDTRLQESEVIVKERIFYLNGVFGAAADYLQILPDLQKQFRINPKTFTSIQAEKLGVTKETVAIHVRRSDYLNAESVHEVLPFTYYKRAIDFIKTKITDPVFYIFGDDEKWIAENFDLADMQFNFRNLSGEQAHLADFFAMSNCRHCIISNSTFAWWAAFLNPNLSKVIVAPGVWLKGNRLNIDETYLTNWHVI